MLSYRIPAASASQSSGWIPDRLVYADNINDERRPSIATDKNGYLWVAYEHYNGISGYYEIYVSNSMDGGNTWSFVQRAYDTIGHNNQYPSITIDPKTDNIYVAYQRELTIADHDIFVLRRVSGSWSISTVADILGSDDRFPSITSEYQYITNYQYISYEHVTNYDNRDLMFAKSTDNAATWIITTVLYGSPTSDTYSNSTITNAEGYIYIACRYGATYNSVSDIKVLRSDDEGSTWTIMNYNVKGATLTEDVSWPSIAATHGGRSVVIAFQYEYSSTDHDIYYSYSADWGSTWNDGNSLAITMGNELTPALAVDGGGSTSDTVYGYVHLVYWDNNNIKYMKASYNALTMWNPDSAQTVNTGNTVNFLYSKPTIATFYRGGEYYPGIAWTDFRGLNNNIYYSTPSVLFSLTFKFMNNEGTDDLTGDVSWIIVKSPTGSYLNLTSYKIPQADFGQWVVTKIVYEGTNVIPTTNPTHMLTSNSTWTINCRIYTIDFTNKFKDSQGNTVSIDSFNLISPDGTTYVLSVGAYYLQNGTFQITNVKYQGSTITSFTPSTFDPYLGLSTITVTLPFMLPLPLIGAVGVVAVVAVIAIATRGRKPKPAAAVSPLAPPASPPPPVMAPTPPKTTPPPTITPPPPAKLSAYNEEIARYQKAIAILENQRTIGEISIESYNLAIASLQKKLQELTQLKQDVTKTKRSIITDIQSKGGIGRSDIIKDYEVSSEVANIAVEELLREGIIEGTESGERYRLKGRTKRCPYCRGSIPSDLDVCPLCGSTISH